MLRLSICASLALALFSASADAGTIIPAVPANDQTPLVQRVAGGCGPNGWRGPWGHCRYTPYYGRLPNGYYQPRPVYMGNGCPPGYWRGPWGHCRNTPYHGRLPNGGWK
jgi:hypothetical protein